MGMDVRHVIAAALALTGLSLGGCKETDEGKPAGGPWMQSPATSDVATKGSMDGPRTPAGGAGAAAAGMGGMAGMAAGGAGAGGAGAGGAGAGGAAGMAGAAGAAGAAAGGDMAEATIEPFGDGTVTGTATFTADGTDVTVVVTLMNCPDGAHGVHIHEGTSCADATMQGAHWGPTRGEGIPNVMCSGMTGTAMLTRAATDPMLAWTIGGDAMTDVVGHAFVVHGPPPADTTMPAPRIGCGVITAK